MIVSHDQPNRSGITLLEVLIAIGILSVGLASVFALIPAARHLSGKALNYDRSAVLTENAFNDFLTRGFHNPRTWVPSPLASAPEWPFAPGGPLTNLWPAVVGSPASVPNVIIFDPLDSTGLPRDPTQPPDTPDNFPRVSSAPVDLTHRPIWEGPPGMPTHPVIRLNGNPHNAPLDPIAHLPSPPSHPFQYEPSYGNGAAYSDRLVDELFRLQDDVAYSLDGVGPDDPPLNIFANGQLGQREFQGRYSCLFMLFRVGDDWQPGQMATLTVVVFRDRDPTRSPVMLTSDLTAPATWRIGHSGSVLHPYPMANALADFRVKDVINQGTLVYDAGTLSWWKAMYAPNNDNVSLLRTAVASSDLTYVQNQCVWTAMGPNAVATGPTSGPLFAFPDAVAVSHRQIVLAGDDRWSE